MDFLIAESYGRALGILEGVWLYCPDGRRFIESLLEEKLVIRVEEDPEPTPPYGPSVRAA